MALRSSGPDIADIFRRYGPGWREANRGHINLNQLKVMSAIEACRTAELGGHVAACTGCGHDHIAYNSCKNRHCPKCQGPAARDWMEARAEDLLPVEYFHVVFTLPAQIAHIAYWNKKIVYDLLFKASAETLRTIAADPKHLGAKIGFTSVLHTWGSAMTHHPHVHIVVPGGGLISDGEWKACSPGFFLPVRVLSRLFRRLFLEGLKAAHQAGHLLFFGELAGLSDAGALDTYLKPLRKMEWVVYAKPPFGGPEAVLNYLSRYTHRIAISNSRIVSANAANVTFKWKDYRASGAYKPKTMTITTPEFIRRFLIHVLPPGFHRIRHYGFLASSARKRSVATIRALLGALEPESQTDTATSTDETMAHPPLTLRQPCPDCGGVMRIIETFKRGQLPRAPPQNPTMARGPPKRAAA